MLTQELDVIFTALFLLSGLIIGSLLNVFVYRIPLMHANPDNKKRLNLFWPRSQCRNCCETVRWQHNIPIISYLFLKGKGLKNELTHLKNNWTMKLEVHPSVTNPDGSILKMESVARVIAAHD